MCKWMVKKIRARFTVTAQGNHIYTPALIVSICVEPFSCAFLKMCLLLATDLIEWFASNVNDAPFTLKFKWVFMPLNTEWHIKWVVIKKKLRTKNEHPMQRRENFNRIKHIFEMHCTDYEKIGFSPLSRRRMPYSTLCFTYKIVGVLFSANRSYIKKKCLFYWMSFLLLILCADEISFFPGKDKNNNTYLILKNGWIWFLASGCYVCGIVQKRNECIVIEMRALWNVSPRKCMMTTFRQ